MLNIKELNKAIEQLASEKEIDPEQVLEAVESSLASAYKKEFEKKGEIVRCKIDRKTGDLEFVQVKIVVDESSVRIKEEGEEEVPIEIDPENPPLPLYNPEKHIFLDEAKKIKKDAVLGDEIVFDLESPSSDFGRIAAQTAKQVILQKIREIEKNNVKDEFKDKVGGLVTGIIQRIERGNVFIDLGKASGIMFFSESIPGEHYRIGERLRFYLLDCQDSNKGPNLILSRSHPKFVSKLFELEVPEIADGVVQVKAIAREAGSRTKIAVDSSVDGVDPVGACVGQRGARVMAVNSELGNEKIDIIEWSEDDEKYISSSLSPASVTSVELTDRREAIVLVPEDQLSLAIGRSGQNVRLAAKLTGWKIDVRSQSQPEKELEGGVSAAEEGKNKEDSMEEKE